MMHQPVGQNRSEVDFNDRPEHPTVIQKDEVLDLLIDLGTLDTEYIYAKYFD